MNKISCSAFVRKFVNRAATFFLYIKMYKSPCDNIDNNVIQKSDVQKEMDWNTY